jgi:hypothetical protein
MPADAALTEAPAVLRAERRLRLLEELSQIGMDLARTLHRRALAATDPAEPAAPDDSETSDRPAGFAPDPSIPFARISRAIRLTLALEARTDESLLALRAGITAEREARRVANCNRASAEAASRSHARREAVERLVIEAAEREIDDEEALNDVLEALEERLADDEAYEDLDRAPLRETVERLCADLQLTPDWSQWEGEGWTPAPPFSRPKTSIWARPSRMPLRPYDEASQPGGAQALRTRRLE